MTGSRNAAAAKHAMRSVSPACAASHAAEHSAASGTAKKNANSRTVVRVLSTHRGTRIKMSRWMMMKRAIPNTMRFSFAIDHPQAASAQGLARSAVRTAPRTSRLLHRRDADGPWPSAGRAAVAGAPGGSCTPASSAHSSLAGRRTQQSSSIRIPPMREIRESRPLRSPRGADDQWDSSRA